MNEIRVLASIRHTNIVRYCDAFVEKDNLYIVMEFAERGDIYHKIKKYKEANRCIREDVIWSYFIQICRGLNELHSRRILHRVRGSAISLSQWMWMWWWWWWWCIDSPVIVTCFRAGHQTQERLSNEQGPRSHRRPWLLEGHEVQPRTHSDRWVAAWSCDCCTQRRRVDAALRCCRASRGGAGSGTPYYMSPEIWSKQAYDEKSDMWALGCLLFELCSMQPPFLAKDVTGLAQKVKTAQSPLIPRHYSSDLQSLVQRLLGTASTARQRPRRALEPLTTLTEPVVTAHVCACVHVRRLWPCSEDAGIATFHPGSARDAVHGEPHAPRAAA